MRHCAAALLVVALVACTRETQLAPWLTYPQCTSCHGDFRRGATLAAAAPPFDLAGLTTTAAPGVGAHEAHLVDGPLRVATLCSECHLVPAEQLHSDGVVQVVFGPVASTMFVPLWNATALTCSTYCHGGTTGGGALKVPVWTRVDGSQAACGTCHGVPPPAPHVQSNDCGGCHAGSSATTVDPRTHVDGVLQTTGGCTSCHGDPAAPPAYAAAPPRDTQGRVAPSAPGVGAHRAHVADGALRGGLACTECHPPTDRATHPDRALTVSFGPLARAAGFAPVWNAATATCSATYCHGSAALGATAPAPVWTRVDGSASACSACHGLPPPSPHPQQAQCGACHTGYTASTVVPATHVDGVIDMDPTAACSTCTCTACHGDAGRLGLASASSPPRDLAGRTVTTARGVGAHRAHLEGGPLARGVACTECHPVPASSARQGPHQDGVVQVDFGPLSSTSTVPSFDGTALTCTGYCHGATLAGGTLKAPLWTRVDGTQAACGTCHGVPPPMPHVQLTACGGCHPGSTASTVDPTTHVDGTLQTVPLSCTSCHGDAARAVSAGADPRTRSAPPVDTDGGTTTSLRGVGAHLAHLDVRTGAIAAPTACTECHVVPASNLHADGAAGVTFGARARTGGVAPAWNGTTCSATYCHGATLLGGTATAPTWTRVDGTQRACAACHGNPPSTGRHTSVGDHRRAGCGACHAGYTATTANVAAHVDGARQVGGRITSYNRTTRACTNTCHGNEGSW